MDIHSSRLPAPQAHAISHATHSHEAQPAPIVATDARRRPAVVAPGGLAADDVECPVCMSILNDPFVTICGHAFCHRCISTHLAHRQNCPSCAAYLTADNIYPNFLLQMVSVSQNTVHDPIQYWIRVNLLRFACPNFRFSF